MKALFRMLFSPAPETYPAHRLYVALSDAARNPFFYHPAPEGAEVPDTLDGRYDMLIAHLFLALRRLKQIGGTEAFQQALIECFFSDLDRALREMGVGDLGVGRRIRAMADGFHGRITRYEAAHIDAAAWRAALADNVYRGDATRADAGIDTLAQALAQFEVQLDGCDEATLKSGGFCVESTR
jgi:cytochrome b pre-mRNA-processing protein 3